MTTFIDVARAAPSIHGNLETLIASAKAVTAGSSWGESIAGPYRAVVGTTRIAKEPSAWSTRLGILPGWYGVVDIFGKHVQFAFEIIVAPPASPGKSHQVFGKLSFYAATSTTPFFEAFIDDDGNVFPTLGDAPEWRSNVNSSLDAARLFLRMLESYLMLLKAP